MRRGRDHRLEGRAGAAAALALLLASVAGCSGEASEAGGSPAVTAARPVVVDTDLAVDSVMALLYLLGRPDLDIRAITVSGTGEVTCGPGAEIATGLVALAGRQGVPVACGPAEPLQGANAFPADWRAAADEAWGLDLPAGEAPAALAAPELLVQVIAASPEPVTLFCEGPLTNLAAALRLDPGIVGNLAMVYVMGGAVDVPGNTPENPAAEYNIWVDPVAAAEVFSSGAALTLVPLDATNQVPLEARHLRVLQGYPASPAAAAAVTMLGPRADWGLFFWDQLAAAMLVDDTLAGFETMRLVVVTDGGPEAVGATVRAAAGSPIRVAVSVDTARFEREFLSALAGEDVGPIATPAKTPASTVEELAAALYEATESGDADAWSALCADDARQVVYLVTAGSGAIVGIQPMADIDPSADGAAVMEVLGDPLVSGDAIAVPVRFTFEGEGPRVAVGLSVIVARRVMGGLLVAGSAGFLMEAEPGSPATAGNAAAIAALAEAQAVAWNAGDLDGVLATMTADVAVWDVIHPEPAEGDALRAFLQSALALESVVTGEPVVAGAFAALPHRLTDPVSGLAREGLVVYWERDGSIALQAYAMGE